MYVERNSHPYLSRCNIAGAEQHRFLAKTNSLSFAGYVGEESGLDFVWGRWDLGPQDRLYAAPDRNAYRIEILEPDGSLVRVIERDYESYTRTAEDRQLAMRYVKAVFQNYPRPPQEYTILDTDADIAGLRVTGSGEVWVTTSRSARDLPDGVGIIYDVFNPEGEYVRQAAVHGSFDPDRDLLRFLGEDRFMVVIGAGEGYLNSMGVGSDEGEETEEAEDVPLIEAIYYEIR